MEDTNKPDSSLRVIWEILPGDREYIFREIDQEDINPSVFSSGSLMNSDHFPLIPHPLLNPAIDCLDWLWTQTVIRINYQTSEWFDEYKP